MVDDTTAGATTTYLEDVDALQKHIVATPGVVEELRERMYKPKEYRFSDNPITGGATPGETLPISIHFMELSDAEVMYVGEIMRHGMAIGVFPPQSLSHYSRTRGCISGLSTRAGSFGRFRDDCEFLAGRAHQVVGMEGMVDLLSLWAEQRMHSNQYVVHEDNTEWVSIDDAAARIDKSVATIYNYIKDGLIDILYDEHGNVDMVDMSSVVLASETAVIRGRNKRKNTINNRE